MCARIPSRYDCNIIIAKQNRKIGRKTMKDWDLFYIIGEAQPKRLTTRFIKMPTTVSLGGVCTQN